MPTYSYQCENCHHQFDIFQHFSEDSLTVCPKCGQSALRKVYSPVGIVFKGSGFYATDHRSPSGQTHAPHDHDSAATENGSDHSADSKSETKTASDTSETGPAKSEPAAPAASGSTASTEQKK